tara:strand:+ start:736 stop:1035 length:300 start_codon:yes stop_codon:yes gene_type:complete
VVLDPVDEPLVEDLTRQYMQLLTNDSAPEEPGAVTSARSDLRIKYDQCLQHYQQQLYERARALAIEQLNARRKGLSAWDRAYEAARMQRPSRSPPRRPL